MPVKIEPHHSILISRTDSIGDVILTIPLTYALKQLYPHNKIIFLATSYTKPILQYIQTIDEIIDYNEISQYNSNEQKQIFQQYQIQAAVIVFPEYSVVRFLNQMKIPYRIATSHRWYNWLYCNSLVSFSRKNSELHEAQLNFHLLKPLGINTIPEIQNIASMYQLKNIPELPPHLSEKLSKEKYKIILHPKSKGSAREWPLEHYINLIKNLDPSKFQILITGTSNELNALQKLLDECPQVLNMVGKTTLHELVSLINSSDALIAASTGTLHIAAMLGKHAIGLFPPIKPMHPGRWAPIGKYTHTLCIEKKCNDCKTNPAQCSCIQQISPNEVLSLLNRIFPAQ